VTLDAAGLKAQVLGRIEVLEGRERERDELVGEVSAAMESRGYDTAALEAVRSG
jgi:hypothetical protein